MLTKTLLAQGLTPAEVLRMQRRGELERVRRGAYVRAADAIGNDPATVSARHRQLIHATIPMLATGAVVSHTSAAVLHGLPVWAEAVERVHVTRDRRTGAKRSNVVEVHSATLTSDQVTVVNGVAVTSLARTVADLGRALPFEQAVAAGDRALALGLSRADVQRTLAQMGRWPGAPKARRVVEFIDGDSESAGESVSRVRLVEDGLPLPSLQRDFFDAEQNFVARSDFCWPEQKTVGEFDGKVKYGRLLKPGQSIADVIFAEKEREDALRDLGWQVVRWLWADLYRRGVIKDRVLRAFARAR